VGGLLGGEYARRLENERKIEGLDFVRNIEGTEPRGPAMVLCRQPALTGRLGQAGESGKHKPRDRFPVACVCPIQAPAPARSARPTLGHRVSHGEISLFSPCVPVNPVPPCCSS